MKIVLAYSGGHDIAHELKDKVREKFSRVRDVLAHIEPRNSETGKHPD